MARLTFAVLALALSASAALAGSSCTRTYKVVENDTCDSIAAAQKVPTWQLMSVNSDIINNACTNLEVGDTLCLGQWGQDCQKTYTVQGSDVCDSITSKFAIASNVFMHNNPVINADCSNIYSGLTLCAAQQWLNVTSASPSSFVQAPAVSQAAKNTGSGSTSAAAEDDCEE